MKIKSNTSSFDFKKIDFETEISSETNQVDHLKSMNNNLRSAKKQAYWALLSGVATLGMPIQFLGHYDKGDFSAMAHFGIKSIRLTAMATKDLADAAVHAVAHGISTLTEE